MLLLLLKALIFVYFLSLVELYLVGGYLQGTDPFLLLNYGNNIFHGVLTSHMIKIYDLDFPAGPVVGSLPANAGVRSLLKEDSTCCRAIKPVSHNYWACTPGARAPQEEPLQ